MGRGALKVRNLAAAVHLSWRYIRHRDPGLGVHFASRGPLARPHQEPHLDACSCASGPNCVLPRPRRILHGLRLRKAAPERVTSRGDPTSTCVPGEYPTKAACTGGRKGTPEPQMVRVRTPPALLSSCRRSAGLDLSRCASTCV